jgi:hypothetical protein
MISPPSSDQTGCNPHLIFGFGDFMRVFARSQKLLDQAVFHIHHTSSGYGKYPEESSMGGSRR